MIFRWKKNKAYQIFTFKNKNTRLNGIQLNVFNRATNHKRYLKDKIIPSLNPPAQNSFRLDIGGISSQSKIQCSRLGNMLFRKKKKYLYIVSKRHKLRATQFAWHTLWITLQVGLRVFYSQLERSVGAIINTIYKTL